MHRRGNHTPAEATELAAPDDPFDVVLASDCLYDSAMLAGFRKALGATCDRRTVLLMAYKRRLDRYRYSTKYERLFWFLVPGIGATVTLSARTALSLLHYRFPPVCTYILHTYAVL